MPSIINFIQEVANSNPNNQSIHIRATSPWLNALAAQFPIVNNVILALHSNNNGERTILRSDVKYSNTAEEKKRLSFRRNPELPPRLLPKATFLPGWAGKIS